MNRTKSSYDAVETAIDLVKVDRSSPWADLERKADRYIPPWNQSVPHQQDKSEKDDK